MTQERQERQVTNTMVNVNGPDHAIVLEHAPAGPFRLRASTL